MSPSGSSVSKPFHHHHHHHHHRSFFFFHTNNNNNPVRIPFFSILWSFIFYCEGGNADQLSSVCHNCHGRVSEFRLLFVSFFSNFVFAIHYERKNEMVIRFDWVLCRSLTRNMQKITIFQFEFVWIVLNGRHFPRQMTVTTRFLFFDWITILIDLMSVCVSNCCFCWEKRWLKGGRGTRVGLVNQISKQTPFSIWRTGNVDIFSIFRQFAWRNTGRGRISPSLHTHAFHSDIC